MLGIENITNYQSVWEQAENIPAGLPLRRRSQFPEYLSTAEIADLLFELSDDVKVAQHLLQRDISEGNLKCKAVIASLEPVDPLQVIRNLHSHIRLIEGKLQEFQQDIVRVLEKNVKELEQDIYKTRENIASTLQNEIMNLKGECDHSHHRESIRSRIDGRLLRPKTRTPIRGGKSIGYNTKHQHKNINLVHQEDMRTWLKKKNEWPLEDSIPLSRWFPESAKHKKKPLVNATREMILKMVAEDLKKEGKNPLAFQEKVADVFELCRQKAIAEFGYAHAFTQESTWRNHFWNKSKPPNPKGILELADPRSRVQKS